MSRTALYQKYRSQSFDELVGQEYVVQSIKNAVKMGKIGHAYLFCGPRGTGKTSMARLLARAVNCENPAEAPCGHCESCLAAMEGTHPDIIEVNAANETHVDDIRDLIERAQLAPMMSKHKIYIIDEVHQLSSSAASALLKTLEEPPEHVIFILATTDPQKLINTIISRCQRFDFTRVSKEQIRDHLIKVSQSEGFEIEENAAQKIAELADGGMRDALSILEQVSSYAGDCITEEQINRVYGLSTNEQKLNLLACIYKRNLQGVLTNIQQYESGGMDLKRLTLDLIDCLKDGVIYRYTKEASLLRKLSAEEARIITDAAPAEVTLKMADRLIQALDQYKTGQSVTSILELACMEMITWQDSAALTPVQQMSQVQPVRVAEPIVKASSNPIITESVAVEKTPVIEMKPTEPEPVSESLVQIVEEVSTEETPLLSNEIVCDLDADQVVTLLVQCDKDNKPLIKGILDQIRIAKDKYSAALIQSELKAAGPDCVLFTCPEFAVSNYEAPEFHKALYFYMKELGVDRMPYFMSNEVYDEAVRRFRVLRSNGGLPQPMMIERYVDTTVKVDPKTESLQKAQSLFGADMIEIIEGE